jgi:hypothetical protein
MNSGTKILLAAVVAAMVIAGLRLSKHPLSQESKTALKSPATTLPQHSVTETPPPIPTPTTETRLILTSTVPTVYGPVTPKPNRPSAAPQNQTAPAGEPHRDLMARAALSLVGTGDPDAEAYWMDAIFDPSLPDQEREDLMEDLNEEGLSDPRHPGPEDLPLIVNRLAIIEEVAPYADSFMIEHLGEAYKDLVGLLNGRSLQ